MTSHSSEPLDKMSYIKKGKGHSYLIHKEK